MEQEQDGHHRRVLTLVQLCQRAAAAQVDSIYSLGDDLTYSLVKPILERCTPEQLIHFEQLSPHLRKDTPEIWKDLCFRKYRLMAIERYSFDDGPQEPDSWKSRFFALQDAEAKRIEEVGSKLRTQRMEADERKKEKEVKYTDRIPDAKRPRTTWNAPPKTLFQKIKSEASKVQRAYSARVLPPMPTFKNYRVLPHTSGAALPSAPSATTGSRVVVNTVLHRRSSTLPSTSHTTTPNKGTSISTSISPLPPRTETPNKPTTTVVPVSPSGDSVTPSCSVAESPRTHSKVPITTKKDPMASLFVPRRKIPQRPV
ncbi:hypothetical protein GALMADRAFT_280740 [Galerina marginata CBS 339.88]|uniref:Elongin-A n=1 Tax=Galerina marginata (strain CBS 339.88) TaxID=685588 RepID=A0A067SRS8_GALM3|nr:hypothetical protein GALMADRAFT_280740 [Galerina marginata CBS 339.88]